MNQMEESARSEHWALQGIYWITKLRTNHTHRVYQKIRGRKAFLYKRGKDWIVGYDTGEGKNTDDNGKMSYIIPGKKFLRGEPSRYFQIHYLYSLTFFKS